MTQVTAKFIFKLPFPIMRQREHGSEPQCIKTGSEEIVVYPPAKYEYSLFEEPLWSPDHEEFMGKLNGEPVWKANCIPIYIRKDFSAIPITDAEQKALVVVARDIIYKLLTMYRWRGGQLQVDANNVEKLDYDLRYFDGANKRINVGPGGTTGGSLINVSTMLPEIIEWNDICHYLIAENMPELHESLLLDARSVVFREPRRAVLDAAIACEVFIKKFCDDASQSNPEVDPVVYSALTPRGIPLLSYFHEVLRYLFKYSFKEKKQTLYKELDCLIRTNNSVKHEGLLQYKDDKGKIIKVDSHRARKLINAVEEAIEYIRSFVGEP